MLNSLSSVPLHTQVSNYIRERIYARDWETDTQIPTEFELMELLGVSRGTVKKAISALVQEGLLVQIRGKGTFVTSPNITHPSGNALLSFAESLQAQGIEFTTEVIEKTVIYSDKHLVEKIAMPLNSPVLFLKRRRLVEGKPIMYIENRVNLLLAPGLQEIDFEKETLFSSIEKCSGKRIGYSSAKYAAKVAGEQRGHLLEVSEEAPVLHLEQAVFYSDNTQAEWGNVWLRANKYMVATVLQRL